MTATGVFEGYDFPSLVKAYVDGGLCVIDGLASSAHWAAVSKPGNQKLSGRDQAAVDNHADYRRRFDLCRRYVSRHVGLLHYGLQFEASDEGYARFIDPLTGVPFRIHRPYADGFIGEGDVLLPVWDDGTFVILVRDPAVPTVAAVMHAMTDVGKYQFARLPRLDGARPG
jgi:hypothetical protein